MSKLKALSRHDISTYDLNNTVCKLDIPHQFLPHQLLKEKI